METEHKTISRAVIKRLPRYYRYLRELMDEGIERISSSELSHRMNITASQIRQDLNNFGGFGQQGYGYNVKSLYNEIGLIMGLDKEYNLIIIGAGRLGQAIANYTNFRNRGFNVLALFDVNPELIGTVVCGIPVLAMNQLEDFLKEHPIQIAALTLPKDQADEAASRLVEAGVPGIWNFAHTDLQLPDSTVVENVHLSESLMRMSYRLKDAGGNHEDIG